MLKRVSIKKLKSPRTPPKYGVARAYHTQSMDVRRPGTDEPAVADNEKGENSTTRWASLQQCRNTKAAANRM